MGRKEKKKENENEKRGEGRKKAYVQDTLNALNRIRYYGHYYEALRRRALGSWIKTHCAEVLSKMPSLGETNCELYAGERAVCVRTSIVVVAVELLLAEEMNGRDVPRVTRGINTLPGRTNENRIKFIIAKFPPLRKHTRWRALHDPTGYYPSSGPNAASLVAGNDI